jgi:hypothetical protein
VGTGARADAVRMVWGFPHAGAPPPFEYFILSVRMLYSDLNYVRIQVLEGCRFYGSINGYLC